MSAYEDFALVGAGQGRWDSEPVNYGPRTYYGTLSPLESAITNKPRLMFTDSAEQIAQDIADVHSAYMDDYADHSDPDAMPTADDIEEMLSWAGAL
ncbi:hypothetical protein [Mycolicibacterium sphagni]|uniref:Uncharacterized protein n=1 Tax=Mycolicibacterium sphagni TaxID=1786 RepID=A0A255DQY3_9MYCO|nr:hypothetical protein [Mycolicibacterium sphagni]OYN81766.1 hypothetical protein CG716_05335 [Mycolicibacterium sphagni]